MELEQRVKALEYEIKILKNEIQRTLLDIEEQILSHTYLELRSEEPPPAPPSTTPAPRLRPVPNPAPSPTPAPAPQPAVKPFALNQSSSPAEPEAPKINIRKVSLDDIRAAQSEPLPPAGVTAQNAQNQLPPAPAPSQPLGFAVNRPVPSATPSQPSPVAVQNQPSPMATPSQPMGFAIQNQPAPQATRNEPTPPVERRKATPPSNDMGRVPKLLDWSLNGAASIGGERLKALARVCGTHDILSPELEHLAVRIAPLNRRASPAVVGTDAILEVMLQLDKILERPADRAEAMRLIQEAQLG